MPTVLREGPYRFYFLSGDRTEPPHVHVKRDNGFAKFWLNPVQLQKSDNFTARECRIINRIVEQNQAAFLEAWLGMTTSMIELEVPDAKSITVTEAKLTVELADGRLISVPLAWYPRLVHATPAERNNWELIAANRHIHWEDLDEDISVEGLLAGRRSGESEASFKRWLKAKRAGRGIALYELGRAKR